MPSRALVQLPMVSSYRGELSLACQQCAEGRKMVLFVTGLCRFRCFYCPVSPTRNQLDVVYANERRVRSDEDVLVREDATFVGVHDVELVAGRRDRAIEATEPTQPRHEQHHLPTLGALRARGGERAPVARRHREEVEAVRVHRIGEPARDR